MLEYRILFISAVNFIFMGIQLEQSVLYRDVPFMQAVYRLVDRTLLRVSDNDVFGLYFDSKRVVFEMESFDYPPEWFLLTENGFEFTGNPENMVGSGLLTYIFARNHARFIFPSGKLDVRLEIKEGHMADKWMFSPENGLYLANNRNS